MTIAWAFSVIRARARRQPLQPHSPQYDPVVLTAECLDEVLTNLEKRGYRFISLEQALADPAYATPDFFIGPQGFSWLIRWKLAFGQKADWQNEPDPPEWIMQKSRELRKAKP